MEEVKQKNKPLVDLLLDGADELVKKAKKPFIRKKLKRAFESAVDSAEEKKVDAEIKIQDLRKELVKDPEKAEKLLNDIIEQKTIIERADKTIGIVNNEKEAWFE